MPFTDLNKLNFVMLVYRAASKEACYKSGQKRFKNYYLVS